jgi:hypothetical protein
MIKLVMDTNKTLAGLKLDPIACYTCHRGRNSPQSTIPLPLAVPSPPAGGQGRPAAAREARRQRQAPNRRVRQLRDRRRLLLKR